MSVAVGQDWGELPGRGVNPRLYAALVGRPYGRARMGRRLGHPQPSRAQKFGPDCRIMNRPEWKEVVGRCSAHDVEAIWALETHWRLNEYYKLWVSRF